MKQLKTFLIVAALVAGLTLLFTQFVKCQDPCGIDGKAAMIRSSSIISDSYLQVLFYDRSYNETGFRIWGKRVSGNLKHDFTEWEEIGMVPESEGVSLKDGWGNWMTWERALIPASILRDRLGMREGRYMMIRISTFINNDDGCSVESELYGHTNPILWVK